MTVLGVVVLDFCADATEGPIRAYLLDVADTEEQDMALNIHAFSAGTALPKSAWFQSQIPTSKTCDWHKSQAAFTLLINAAATLILCLWSHSAVIYVSDNCSLWLCSCQKKKKRFVCSIFVLFYKYLFSFSFLIKIYLLGFSKYYFSKDHWFFFLSINSYFW